MRIIGRDELLKTKNSNTIVVYGCGLSINSIGKKQRSILSKFDSIGFNWFCKSDIPTTFYLLRDNQRLTEIIIQTRSLLHNSKNGKFKQVI